VAARSAGLPAPLKARRAADRAVRGVRRTTVKISRLNASVGFPYRRPTVPRGVVVPPAKPTLGADYDTEWARGRPARFARAIITNGPLRLALQALASPEVRGEDRLADLKAEATSTKRRRRRVRSDRGRRPPAVIFTPNHHSHLDTPLAITAIPEPWRGHLVVGAAADYFFASHLTSAASALVLNAFPVARNVAGRQSADLARDLIEEGWSLVIFPEGGRSPDGWGQPFKGGAAYLSIRTGAPVVPVFIEGAGSILGKGMKRPKPGKTTVTFGTPLRPEEDESTRHYNERIEQAVTVLGDETLSDWWSARQRAARSSSPALTGPEHTGWRRTWALSEHRNRGQAGLRNRQKRRWPKLD
jgi:1-acyl-sn-glycerol-3-phosphate acyltransferase